MRLVAKILWITFVEPEHPGLVHVKGGKAAALHLTVAKPGRARGGFCPVSIWAIGVRDGPCQPALADPDDHSNRSDSEGGYFDRAEATETAAALNTNDLYRMPSSTE